MRKADPSGTGFAEDLAAQWLGFIAPKISGFVDRIVAGEAIGWAFDQRRPARRMLVVARIRGRVVGETLADLPRRDLKDSNRGDGAHGFRLKLPPNLSEADQAALVIEVRLGWRHTRLKRAKRFREEAATPSPGQVAAPQGPRAGYLERCSEGVLKGWAVDPNNPETAPAVDVFAGEVFLGFVVADIDRPRLRETGAPSGAKGFEFRLPPGPVALETLRARIANTRIELRRGRSFLEGTAGDGHASGWDSAPEGAEAQRLGPARPAPQHRLAFLICGRGDAASVATTLAGVGAQTLEGLPRAVLDGAEDLPPSVLAIPADDEATLRAWLEKAATVVFLAPGQSIDPSLASHLVADDGQADVRVWAARGQTIGEDVDLAITLGAPSNGLAVRSPVLERLTPPDFLAVRTRGLRALEVALARADLSWAPIGTQLSDALPGRATHPWSVVPERPRRVSLAIWSGWTGKEPPALRPLLEGCADFEVEVLYPASAPEGTAEAIHKLGEGAPRALTARPVDVPGDDGAWRGMARAATGQVVIVCHGAVEAPPTQVSALASWAHRHDIGAVTLPIGDGRGLILAGLGPDDAAADATGLDRPVRAAPAAFMVVSRAALSQVDDLLLGMASDLELGACLRRSGRRSVLLAAKTAAAPTEMLARWTTADPSEATGE